MVPECRVEKLGKLTDAVRGAGADGSGPESAVLGELQFATASLCQEPLHLIRGASKEKDIVKVALPGKFGLSLWQTYVLHEFAGGEGAQSHNRHAGIVGQGLQGIGSRRQGFCDRDTRKPPEQHGCGLLDALRSEGRAQVEL